MNTNFRRTIGQSTVAVFTTLAFAGLAPRAHAQGGIPLWTNRYSGSGYSTYASAAAVDGSGNVFATGWDWNGSNLDYVTIKYSGSGVPLWTNRFNGPANEK